MSKFYFSLIYLEYAYPFYATMTIYRVLKVIWSVGIKGVRNLSRGIPICLISTWKHIMYA